MTSVQLSASNWRGATVVVAETFLERLLGFRSKKAVNGVMLRSKSVHTFGMEETINVFAMDRDHRVIASRRISPNRMVFYRRASAIVELPLDVDPPGLMARILFS